MDSKVATPIFILPCNSARATEALYTPKSSHIPSLAAAIYGTRRPGGLVCISSLIVKPETQRPHLRVVGKRVLIASDLSWISLYSCVNLLNTIPRRCKPVFLGIDDQWLEVLRMDTLNHVFRGLPDAVISEDRDWHLSRSDKSLVIKKLGVCGVALQLLQSGHEIHLDYFFQQGSKARIPKAIVQEMRRRLRRGRGA